MVYIIQCSLNQVARRSACSGAFAGSLGRFAMSSELKNIPDFLGVVALVATRIALKLSVERRQYFIEGDGRRVLEDGLSRLLEELAVQPQPAPAIPQYPANNEKFQLTIDGQTKWFMLVSADTQPNWQSLQAILASHGSATGESERAAFKKNFPQSDGKGPIGFTKIPYGSAVFPCVLTAGALIFYWPVLDFPGSWRWLVEVQA